MYNIYIKCKAKRGEIVEDNLIKTLEKNKIEYDKKYLNKVINYAKENYTDKLRYTGQTLYDHCLGVAIDVANLNLDITSIYACILHELVKTSVDFKDVEEIFNSEIVDIIKGVAKVSYLNYNTNNKVDVQNLRKLFMAIASDIRVVIIKLVDRLYNMRQYENFNKDIIEFKAKETLEIYCPIAHRLGISHIKSELEDICFRILYKEEYNNIKKKIDIKKSVREIYINSKIDEIKESLNKESIKCSIYGRPKHFYSIFKKMNEKNCDIDGVFDLLAVRIVVDSIKDCYAALGIVHSLYKPMPGRFKDYIATPKTNNYQSLHTTVFGQKGMPFEIQIRTWDMQRFAEYGAAAHFMYKEKSKQLDETEQKILWVRQTLELQKELSNNTNNLENFKGELFKEEVFVFTPRGDIKALPKSSTPIDFAYGIHENIAKKMSGSRINGKLVSMFTKLNNTDVVEIITSKNAKGPSFDWLKHVKTTSARNKISSYLKKEGSHIYISKGKEMFEKEVKKQKIPKEELLKEEYINNTIKTLKLNSLDHLYENIGFGTLSYVKAVNKLTDIYNTLNNKNLKSDETKIKIKKDNTDIIEVEGLTNCLVKFSKCCSPILGDEIVGYITNSKGLSIHRKDCNNIVNLNNNDRKINVKWKVNRNENIKFNTNIYVYANYRENLTIEIIKKLSEMKVELINIKATKQANHEIDIFLTINTNSVELLNKVIRTIKKIDNIYEVKRQR